MPMKSLHEYLTSREKEHKFRFKTVHDITDEQMDTLENHLQKYDVIEVSTPKRTIFQSRPLDFYNVDAAHVYIVDFTTRLPVSTGILAQELQQKLGIPEKSMRVRNLHDPVEIQAEEQRESEESDKPKNELQAKLDDAEYKDAEDVDVESYYGEEFKTNFLKELESTRKEPQYYEEKDKKN